jgi:soluble cytochrome b562
MNTTTDKPQDKVTKGTQNGTPAEPDLAALEAAAQAAVDQAMKAAEEAKAKLGKAQEDARNARLAKAMESAVPNLDAALTAAKVGKLEDAIKAAADALATMRDVARANSVKVSGSGNGRGNGSQTNPTPIGLQQWYYQAAVEFFSEDPNAARKPSEFAERITKDVKAAYGDSTVYTPSPQAIANGLDVMADKGNVERTTKDGKVAFRPLVGVLTLWSPPDTKTVSSEGDVPTGK